MSAYARPGTLADALAQLASDGAQPLAGGTDLVPLQARGKAPGDLVDVRRQRGDAIEADGEGLAIGAAARGCLL
jgi:CO/xanthine dehydrogenase FAD-binding subunit